MSAEQPVTGERTVANVAQAKSRSIRLQRRLALLFVALTGAGVLGWYYLHLASASRAEGAQRRSATRASATSEMKLPALGRSGLAATSTSRDSHPPDLADGPAGNTDALMAQGRGAATARAAGASRAEAPRAAGIRPAPSANSPVLLKADSGRDSVAQPGGSGADAMRLEELRRLALAQERGPSNSPALASIGEALVPTVTTPTTAALVPTRRWLLPKGSFLDCTLETAIDSTLPGLATCVLAVDTFGADGRVVLLERGTKLVGETRGDVRSGQARVSVLWSEARTPTGVIVGLASPGTDALGRAGVPGAVDNHFAARFGAAVLLSIIDGAISGFVAHEQGSAGVIYNPQGSRDVATDALRSTVGIPPTINVPAGARIQVLVARDVDFRRVYGLEPHVDR
jgi:type IV secretion system protein VirB10